MTLYSSDGSAYDSDLHHQFDLSQADLAPPEEGPVTGKKSSQPSKAEAESMTHKPDVPLDMVQKTIRATMQHFRNTFMQGPELMRDFMEGKTSSEDEDAIIRAMGVGWKTTPVAPKFIPHSSLPIDSMNVAMNDNTPKIETTVPNIAGGLSPPSKPANDNDNRKPMKSFDWDQFNPEDVDYLSKLSSIPTHMENLKSVVQPSENIVNRKSIEGMIKEFEYDVKEKNVKDSFQTEDDTLHIGLKDLDRYLENAAISTDARKKLLEELQKRVIVPK